MLIHIGYPKTGSTWLQNNVFTNAAKGFTSRWTTYRSREPMEYFVYRQVNFDPHETRKKFDDAHKDVVGLTRVISDEDLCGSLLFGGYSYGFDVGTRLAQTFPEARVLIVVREQKAILLSYYNEYVRWGGEWPLDAYIGCGINKIGYRPICRLDQFEYHHLAKHYLKLYGRDKVLLLPFECLRNDSIAFEQAIHDFCRTGCKADSIIPPVNAAWKGATLLMRRRINRFVRIPPTWQGEARQLSLICRGAHKFCSIADRFIPRRLHRAIESKFKRTISDHVQGYYRESNRELAELFKLDLGTLGYDV